MKNKIAILIAFPVLLTGCQGNSSSIGEHTLVLNYGFVFNHIQNQQGEKLAKLLLNDCYYKFSSDIELDKPAVAGDQLSITFDGDYSILGFSTGPGDCTVTGTIKDYSLIETQIIGLLVDEASMEAAIRNSGYVLDNEYVILDKEGRYTTLDEYPGSNLFLSVNQRKMAEYCTCPEGAQCEPCPIYIAGLYAYNPRSLS